MRALIVGVALREDDRDLRERIVLRHVHRLGYSRIDSGLDRGTHAHVIVRRIASAVTKHAGSMAWRFPLTSNTSPGPCPKNTGDRAELAAQLGTGNSVLCLPGRGAADHLHHPRDRVLVQRSTKGGAWTRSLPE